MNYKLIFDTDHEVIVYCSDAPRKGETIWIDSDSNGPRALSIGYAVPYEVTRVSRNIKIQTLEDGTLEARVTGVEVFVENEENRKEYEQRSRRNRRRQEKKLKE